MKNRSPRLSTTLTVLLLLSAAIILTPAPRTSADTPTFTPVPLSTFFATAAEESYSTHRLFSSDGDLWPSCWGDDHSTNNSGIDPDGALYAANGDGWAFDPPQPSPRPPDMAVSKITGPPQAGLHGITLISNPYNGTDSAAHWADNIGTIWPNPGANYVSNRKPTGMVCVNGHIYLAFQNLSYCRDLNFCPDPEAFNHAPFASIAEGTWDDNAGAWTWSWNHDTAMFDGGIFTTIFFVDYGRNNANAPDNYVYAYGLDQNWREQTELFLARVPNTSILDSGSWQFFTGLDGNGNPTWNADRAHILHKQHVLEDDRHPYGDPGVIAQGGVTYDAPLHRYIFTSWTAQTQEFYEAPQPWGPWSRVLSKDFSPDINNTNNRGMYGTSIPSKFISADGRELYVQSNICCPPDKPDSLDYHFSLRKLYLQPWTATTPANALNDTQNLAYFGSHTTPISKSTRFGRLCVQNCHGMFPDGFTPHSDDDFDTSNKAGDGQGCPPDQSCDWWGYTWNQAYNLNQVRYTTGAMSPDGHDGGWFSGSPRVQVRQNFNWVDVGNLSVTPPYPGDSTTGAYTTYTFNFANTWGDGVRIIGTPGGDRDHFTSIYELAVYYAGRPVFGPSPGDQTVPYHDSLSFTVTASDPDGDPLFFSQSGLPSGLTLTDNHNGTATISGVANVVPNTYSVTFTVDDGHDNTDHQTLNIHVIKEDTTLTYTGDTVIAQGNNTATLSARLLEDGDPAAPIAGRTVDLALASQHCSPMPVTNASGVASCTLTNVTVPQGPQPLTATFAGDAYYLGSSDSKTAIVFAFLASGAFALGDRTVGAATPNTMVTWWGSSWAALNTLSAGAAPAAFKGFASTTSTSPPRCGGMWTTDPGNSPDPPGVSSIPAYMGVVVPTGVTRSGNTISGDVAQIVVVRTNPGYDPNPGHDGTGTIVATYCH